MAEDLKAVIERNAGTLLADALGVVALALMLVATLWLPHLF